MKAFDKVHDELMEIRDEAVQARHKIDRVISCIDSYVDTYDVNDMIIYMRNKGCSYQQIANKVGLATSTVLSRVRKYEAQGLIDYKCKKS